MPNFYRTLTTGLSVIKHCKWPGKPHRRVLWLDTTTPKQPALVWGASREDGSDPKRRLALHEINQLHQGMAGETFKRHGSIENADTYMTLDAQARQVDIELASKAERDWLFRKVREEKCAKQQLNELFHAYAEVFRAGTPEADINEGVRALMDRKEAAVGASQRRLGGAM
jgi:hypothetical protein